MKDSREKRYYLLLLLIKLTICFEKVVKTLTTIVGCFFSWFGRIRFDLFSIKTIVAAFALDPGLLYHFYTTTSSKGHSDKILVFLAFLTFKQIAADLAKF